MTVWDLTGWRIADFGDHKYRSVSDNGISGDNGDVIVVTVDTSGNSGHKWLTG